MTAEGGVEYVNRQVLDYFGRTLEELKQWGTTDAVHPDDLPRVSAMWRSSLEAGTPYNFENRLRELCQTYSWPGNIRELQNIVERSMILCTGDTFSIDEAWLSIEQPSRTDMSGPLIQTLQDQEKEMIEAALEETRGKVAGAKGAAAKLGIPPSTLESKIKQLKIKKQNF